MSADAGVHIHYVGVPYLSVKGFVELGLDPDATYDSVIKRCASGEIPTKPREKNGDKYYINMVLWHKQAAEQPY